ncbi:hypothetical protein FNJ47_48500, partial [Bradyrhizobium sp. UFLA 03-164]|nr:hypothetical protein [Bradyrhizobium uaiense]
LITEHIKLVIGEEWDLRRKHAQTAAARILYADRDGTLDWIDGALKYSFGLSKAWGSGDDVADAVSVIARPDDRRL